MQDLFEKGDFCPSRRPAAKAVMIEGFPVPILSGCLEPVIYLERNN